MARGHRAQQDDDPRIHQLDMAAQEGQAHRRFLGRGIAIVRRPPVDNIGDVGAGAVQMDAASILSSSFPARPTKGRPMRSSSRPGASPMNMMREAGLPSAKTVWVARLLQRAAVEAFQRGFQFGERGRSARERLRRAMSRIRR